jgi:hypothetical protein
MSGLADLGLPDHRPVGGLPPRQTDPAVPENVELEAELADRKEEAARVSAFGIVGAARTGRFMRVLSTRDRRSCLEKHTRRKC